MDCKQCNQPIKESNISPLLRKTLDIPSKTKHIIFVSLLIVSLLLTFISTTKINVGINYESHQDYYVLDIEVVAEQISAIDYYRVILDDLNIIDFETDYADLNVQLNDAESIEEKVELLKENNLYEILYSIKTTEIDNDHTYFRGQLYFQAILVLLLQLIPIVLLLVIWRKKEKLLSPLFALGILAPILLTMFSYEITYFDYKFGFGNTIYFLVMILGYLLSTKHITNFINNIHRIKITVITITVILLGVLLSKPILNLNYPYGYMYYDSPIYLNELFESRNADEDSTYAYYVTRASTIGEYLISAGNTAEETKALSGNRPTSMQLLSFPNIEENYNTYKRVIGYSSIILTISVITTMFVLLVNRDKYLLLVTSFITIVSSITIIILAGKIHSVYTNFTVHKTLWYMILISLSMIILGVYKQIKRRNN